VTATGTRTITVLLETSRDPLTLEGRSFERLELPEGATLADAARAAGIGGRLVAQLNGAIVRPADLERRRLADGDRAYLAPSPGDPINVVLAVIAIASAVASVLLLPKIGRLDNQRGERRYLFDRYSRDAVAGDPITPGPVVKEIDEAAGLRKNDAIDRQTHDREGISDGNFRYSATDDWYFQSRGFAAVERNCKREEGSAQDLGNTGRRVRQTALARVGQFRAAAVHGQRDITDDQESGQRGE